MATVKTLDASKSMEALAIKWGLYISTWVAVPSCILGIWHNWGTWKAELLFVLGIISVCVRIFFEISKRLDESDARKIKNENDRWDLEQKKKNNKNEIH